MFKHIEYLGIKFSKNCPPKKCNSNIWAQNMLFQAILVPENILVRKNAAFTYQYGIYQSSANETMLIMNMNRFRFDSNFNGPET